MNLNSTAVMLTCFNRRKKTLACLRSLKVACADFDVYLVDDCSTDGTAEAIKAEFPLVNLIAGTGDLFWSRGMRLAWVNAARKSYDYFIWLNDDVLLYDNCFSELFECSRQNFDEAIISGIVEAENSSEVIYGGADEFGRLLVPNGEMQSIRNMNGNVVLIPRSVHQRVGLIDPVYHHDLGDVDYGYRAAALNIPVLTTRIAVASGIPNNICRVRGPALSMVARFKKLYSPLGSPPQINYYFRSRHMGRFNAACYYVFLHIINFLPDALVKVIFPGRYI